MTNHAGVPKPRRRLLRTLLKRPRKLRAIAPRMEFAEATAALPDLQEVGQWGQVVLASDTVIVLHRDGTVTRLFHIITTLAGDQDLAEWDEVTRTNRKGRFWQNPANPTRGAFRQSLTAREGGVRYAEIHHRDTENGRRLSR